MQVTTMTHIVYQGVSVCEIMCECINVYMFHSQYNILFSYLSTLLCFKQYNSLRTFSMVNRTFYTTYTMPSYFVYERLLVLCACNCINVYMPLCKMIDCKPEHMPRSRICLACSGYIA